MARRIIVDTNFLLIPAVEGVDVFAELERVCSSAVQFTIMNGSLAELEEMARQGSTTMKRSVALAQKIMAAKQVQVIDHLHQSVDDAILEEAQPGDLVATMDKELRSRLKKKGVDTAVLRKRQHVVILEA